ncbi:hypothetical protein CPLU01_03359 [Colletotrichum plurivorum]|uniref:Uncharacterized protein n=1 Tax=Colletotrichum plurivorum TaxID=2175906 RepID=A0A8H6KSZ7_9PEZI|nr:hypothetical protein CPLU01_03359 [Colletotrichum plurivorum]
MDAPCTRRAPSSSSFLQKTLLQSTNHASLHASLALDLASQHLLFLGLQIQRILGLPETGIQHSSLRIMTEPRAATPERPRKRPRPGVAVDDSTQRHSIGDEALAALGTSDAALDIDNSACGEDSEAATRLFALRLPQPSMPNPPHSPIDCFFSLSRDDAAAAARCVARQILTGSEGIVRRRRVSFERSGFGGRLVQESFVIPELWPLAGPRHSKVQGPSAPMASVTKIDVPSQSSDPTHLSRPDRSSSPTTTTTTFYREQPPPGRSVALQRDGLFLQAAFYPVPRPMRLDKTEPRGLASSQEPQLRFTDGLPRPPFLLDVLIGEFTDHQR